MLKKLSGGGALHCDKVWGRGEPRRADLLQKLWFWKNLLMHAEEIPLCTQKRSLADIFSVYTKKTLLLTQKESRLRAQGESSNKTCFCNESSPHGSPRTHTLSQ